MNIENLPYDPNKLPRELKRHFISASDDDIDEILKDLELKSTDDLFSHIKDYLFDKPVDIGEEKSYQSLIEHLKSISQKNNIKPSFIGDGLKSYKVPKTTDYLCSLRGLTTAYTPYQPERSQGTLHSLWLYSSAMYMLTGFEAINASLYDRASCLYEAISTAIRLKKGKKKTIIMAKSIFPGDIEVVKTISKFTGTNIVIAPLCKSKGALCLKKVVKLIGEYRDDVASLVFPQINTFGVLENVNRLTDICRDNDVISIAIIDPMTLATGGLRPPSLFGRDKKGVDMIVGEGQHLALSPNFGGPGLGIFGIRYNLNDKNSIRATAGRYVGKAVDGQGMECFCMVLSTREQHIRREKATSNICSNQSFLATLAGAGILSRGELGMQRACKLARDRAIKYCQKLTSYKGVELAFKNSAFFNEFTLKLSADVDDVIKAASDHGLFLGVNVSSRINDLENLLLISFTDVQQESDLLLLENFFDDYFKEKKNSERVIDIPNDFKRQDIVNLPNFKNSELFNFYNKLSRQNISPDENIYPLGSCTMKYNPYINDYAANLKGFTDIHPQVPVEDSQGSLQILYEIQEMFQSITGLDAVTTQPVAGAQGELVGLKIFQAYHGDNNEADKRNIIVIPKSAHGTNPATTTMAGYKQIIIDADERGQIDIAQLTEIIDKYGDKIAGAMVTNPNTSGIFEENFSKLSSMIHSVGGLVYMDGANMNAIAGFVDLKKLGVDAVHNNLHKTWSIPHGGGGPGDAIVAVCEKLKDYLPGVQIKKNSHGYYFQRPKNSIGSFHRHFGNFAHKVRCYTYLKALGSDGIKRMSSIAVLSARYLYKKLKDTYPMLPSGSNCGPVMHEFILTISDNTFERIESVLINKSQIIPLIGKLFLDYGLHAPTVAFPETYGLMIEPTESFNKRELDRFIEILKSINNLINEYPQVLKTTPHFTPVSKIDEVSANRFLNLYQNISALAHIPEDKLSKDNLNQLSIDDIEQKILKAHRERTCE